MADFIYPTRDIKKGCVGKDTKWVQNYLNNTGSPQSLFGEPLKLDGDCGTKTDKAIRRFQQVWGLKEDGVVGAKTREALKNAVKSKTDRICHWAEWCGKYMVSHGWRYSGGSFATASTWYKMVNKGKKQASCAAYVSWVSQLAGILDSGKEISHSSAGKGIGAKAVTHAKNLHGGKYVYPNKQISRISVPKGSIVWFDSNICFYAGNGQFWDAGGPFSANCDKSKSGKNRYTHIPSASTYDTTKNVLAYYKLDD